MTTTPLFSIKTGDRKRIVPFPKRLQVTRTPKRSALGFIFLPRCEALANNAAVINIEMRNCSKTTSERMMEAIETKTHAEHRRSARRRILEPTRGCV
jgi:hypothetical protein